MNVEELIDHLGFVLDFNDGQPNQAFSESRMLKALNLAYTRECSKAQLQGSRRFFQRFEQFTWSASEVTLTLPTNFNRDGIIQFYNVTADTDGPGIPLFLTDNGQHSQIYWKDINTLAWGSTGPASDQTLRVYYLARPEELKNDGDEPVLIPREYHELLVWSAACQLKVIADEKAPQEWMMQREELRAGLWKHLSKSRPLDDVPTIRHNTSTNSDWYY
jgi:hypothetical protein